MGNFSFLYRVRRGITARIRNKLTRPSYYADGMKLYNRTFDFREDPKFVSAYRRGMTAGYGGRWSPRAMGELGPHFRAYMECWAASQTLHLPGDLVCCGVNRGSIPLAICEYIDIGKTGKTFWLFDTYEGIPEDQISDGERARGRAHDNIMYPDCYEETKANFSAFPAARLVRGRVPESLDTVPIGSVSYLSLDMNIAYPERKALEHFWPKLQPGGIVILDDYGFTPYAEQRQSADEFARSVGISVCALPTGQGMMIKPSAA
jgi:O-methyltransferase